MPPHSHQITHFLGGPQRNMDREIVHFALGFFHHDIMGNEANF